MRKSYTRFMASRITGILDQIDPFTLREARPRNNAVIRGLVDPIVDENRIPDSDYLMLDYVLEQTLTGKPYAVLWWLPAEVLTSGLHSITRRNVRSSDRTTGNIVGDIIGHAYFAQVGGPRLEFWQERYLNYVPRVPAPVATVSAARTAPIASTRRRRTLKNVRLEKDPMYVPPGAFNHTVLSEEIKEGDEMVNFQGEYDRERYYLASEIQRWSNASGVNGIKHPQLQNVVIPYDDPSVYRYIATLKKPNNSNGVNDVSNQIAGKRRRKTRRNH